MKKDSFKIGEVVVYTPEEGKAQEVTIYDRVLPDSEAYLCTFENTSILPVEAKYLSKK